MKIETAIDLIKGGVRSPSLQTWVDLGAGQGLFTKALGTCLPAGSTLYAVDKDGAALRSVAVDPAIILHTLQQDFVREPLAIELLDGVLMANALHFVEDQVAFIQRLRKSMKTTAAIVLVEYNTDHASRWVPYPMSYTVLQNFSKAVGFTSVELLGEVPSAYQGTLYSAMLS